MNGERKSCTERILSAIEYGKLPNHETERRLIDLIEAEVKKTDSAADMELIDACQSLLWQFHTHGGAPYESHCDQNWAQITTRLRHDALVTRTAKSVGKIFAVAAAIVFLILGLRGDLSWNWLEHDDTPDQQQHIISGSEIGIDMIQTAIAEHGEGGMVRVTSPEELADHISFVPVPKMINNTWMFTLADISITPIFITIDTQYESLDAQAHLLYSVVVFTNAEDAYLAFEQSAEGDTMNVNGHRVYVAKNINRTTICWTDGLVFVRLSGEFNEQEGLTIIQNILEEWY